MQRSCGQIRIVVRAWPAALVVAVAAGCGSGSSRIDRPVADRLAQRSDAVAAALEHGDGCAAARDAAALRADARRAIARGSVPARLAPQLRSAVASLERRIVCRPPAPAPPPAPPAAPGEEGGDGHEGHGHGKGRGKKGDEE